MGSQVHGVVETLVATRERDVGTLRNCPHLSSFSQAYNGGGGVRGRRSLFLMSFMKYCDFEKRSQNQHFQVHCTLLVGKGGSQKEYSMYALS